MLNIPNETLKITQPGELYEQSPGLEVDIKADSHSHESQNVLTSLQGFQEEITDERNLKLLSRILYTKVGDQLYHGRPPTPEGFLDLSGPNLSKLACHVFLPSRNAPTDTMGFARRSRLKYQRTRKNLEELLKAYPDEPLLTQFQSELGMLDIDMSPYALYDRLFELNQGQAFQEYLRCKSEFLQDWIIRTMEDHARIDLSHLRISDLQEIMKALLQQDAGFKGRSEVLRYTNHQFFRFFNAFPHPHAHSNGIDFWKTQENRDTFHYFVSCLQDHFGIENPFYIFRFEKSFTYFMCGFSDQELLQTAKEGKKYAPVYAKIIMRQADRSYRELSADRMNDQILYINTIKTAMYPFITKLNKSLSMNLDPKFIQFFDV